MNSLLVHEKVFNIISHWGNAIKNHNKVPQPTHCLGWL